ncbi:SLC13 family permease [Prevotella sp. E13-27]|uniref:SLC13 family permease n=1 Tax=Prevotella sp. E13-27 TaxID=2938122 RepID=UPI00200B8A44|nr:SLC13 family permease [Prevotella sp. E13-27]MCK8623425.1 SLC13 family permease [Prevotella sp. E13-27]
MTLIIVLLLVFGYLLISTSHFTGVSKAAVAMFIGTAGWVVYVCWGSDFVMRLYEEDYTEFLAGSQPTSDTVKYFIHDNIFLKYVGKAASIVMFLVATMSIVEILNNNGCFDFIKEWIRTRNSKRLLWTITFATFIVSANLDNLTTATLMLVIMRDIVTNRQQRLLIGSAIVLAANAGGCFTVIGDPIGLILWCDGAITATHFSAYLAAPALAAWIVPTILINYQLPDRIATEWGPAPYRGNDTRLNRWQRALMLILGICGLWFIPTFHNITKLSPFLGALCILSLLWIVNEAFNRKLMQADQMIQRRIPQALQYGALQQMLFVMGIMLAMGVMTETGVLGDIADTIFSVFGGHVWVIAFMSGLLASFVDTFTVAMTNISFFPVSDGIFAQNGIYWTLIAFCTAIGGCLLLFGSTSGIALMKMERIRISWYLRNLTPKILAGFVVGLVILYLEYYFA